MFIAPQSTARLPWFVVGLLLTGAISAAVPADEPRRAPEAVAHVDQRLDTAFKALVARDYPRAQTVLAEVIAELTPLEETKSTATQLAEAEMLLAVSEFESKPNSLFVRLRAQLFATSAVNRFQRHWLPSQVGSPPLDDMIVLKRTLDRFQNAPFERVAQLPPDLLEYLTHAANDAGRLFHSRQFHEARECYELSLRLWNARYGHSRSSDSLKIAIHSNLSILLNRGGFHHEALKHARASITYDSDDDATTINLCEQAIGLINVGSIHETLGDNEAARREYETALKLLRDNRPRQQSDVGLSYASALSHIASIESDEGRDELALSHLREVLEIRMLWNEDESKLSKTFHDLGVMCEATGRHDEAQEWFEKAVSTKREYYSPLEFPRGHPSLAVSLNVASSFRLRRGDLATAEAFASEAISLQRSYYSPESFPNGHRQIVKSLALLAEIHAAQSRSQEAWTSLTEAAAMAGALVDNFAIGATLQDAIAFADELHDLRDEMLMLPRDAQVSDADIYRYVWESKSCVSRIIRQRNQVWSRSGDAETDYARQRLEDVSRRIVQQSAAVEPASEGHARSLQAMRDEQRQWTARLRELAGGEFPQARLEVADLIASLPEDAAFVDVVRTDSFVRHGVKRVGRYWAFILRRDTPELRRVEIGDAEEIDETIDAFCDAIINRRENATRLGNDLSRMTWRKLEPWLNSPRRVQQVFISPDGRFDRLPWDALPSVNGGRYLLEDYAISRVIHGELLAEQLRNPSPPLLADNVHATLIGGVAFGSASAGVNENQGDGPPPLRRFSELTDADGEVQSVAAIMAGHNLNSVELLRSTAASPEAVVASIRQAQIAHFATHLVCDGVRERRQHESGKTVARSTLEFAGIVLAHANEKPENVLRGAQISQLPLHHLRLVNLAGCHGGAGVAHRGESGTTSLEHAFQLAGVQVTVASLWEADSTVASFLMTAFYRELFSSPQPSVPQALRQAKLAVLRNGPASDAFAPYYWANWYVTGSPLALSLSGTAIETRRDGETEVSTATARTEHVNVAPRPGRMFYSWGLAAVAALCLLAALRPLLRSG